MTRWLCLALALAACPPGPAVEPAPGPATCAAACDRWRQLGCIEAAHTPDGTPCEDVCSRWERYWDLSCMSSVATCEAIEACP